MSKAWYIFLYFFFVVFSYDVAVATCNEVYSSASTQGDPSQWFYAADIDKSMAADAFKYQAGYEIDAGLHFSIGCEQTSLNYCIPGDEVQRGTFSYESLILFEADTSPPLF